MNAAAWLVGGLDIYDNVTLVLQDYIPLVVDTVPEYRSKTGPDWSWIFFGPAPVRVRCFWQIMYAAEKAMRLYGRLQNATHQLLLSVRLIARQRRCGAAGAAGQGMNQLPEPTAAAAYRMHKYNWLITTARTLDLSWSPSIQSTADYTVCSQWPLVLSPSELC